MGLLVIAAIIGFFWVCSKISQANREQQEREARARREAEQRRIREIQERAAAEERRKREVYLQRRRDDPYFDMMERQKEEREKEAKRQAELTRRRNLAAQFKYITLGGHKAAYCFDYYPKNRFPSVTAQQEADRRAVWNFKDGSYSYGLNRLADFLDGNFTKEEMKNVVVCVIPASTQYKNDLRYKTMCAKIAEKFPVINGYNYITINTDRSDSRTQKSSDTVWNLSFSSSVRGKTVVLFDDITTRGTSFIQVANKLKEAGASNVHGFFLGKTLSY
jgi:predicted amidophosphoribosyltransferase